MVEHVLAKDEIRVRFPVAAQSFVDTLKEGLINKIPKEVDALVSARAIESETVFVYVNAAGNFSKSDILLGRTQIALPFYGTTDILSHNKEGVIIKEVDLSIVKDAKKVYKIERDLKDYYRNNKV